MPESSPPRAVLTGVAVVQVREKLEGETKNMGVCTREWKGMTAVVLMAAPCTKSLGGGSGCDL